jgi:carboxylesterase type B
LAKAISGVEDCLMLSVYTPSLPSKGQDLLPVMFWIHGGAFYLGSGNADFNGADRIMDYGVVSTS